MHPHTTTGALSSQAATVAGSAAHEHATAGALAAGAAEITGAALRLDAGVHVSEGALQAQEATLAGNATLTPNPDSALTDPKFQGPSHNTRIRWERKRKEAEQAAEPVPAPEPAAAPPEPKRPPRSTGMGEPPMPTAAPVEVKLNIPTPKVVALPTRKTPEPAVVPEPVKAEPAPSAPPAISDADLQRVATSVIEQVAAVFEGAVTGLTREVVQLQKQIQQQATAHAKEMARITEMLRAAEKREINRARAEALARKIAEDDE